MFGLNSSINREFIRRSNKLLRGVTVLVDENKFRILDLDCLAVLSHESETFMPYWFTPATGHVVVDIGAHVGKYAVSSGKTVGDKGKVIAIEPDQVNYQFLVSNLLLNNVQNVTTINIAAWNKESDLKLYHGDMSGHHSVKEDWRRGHDFVRARPIGRVLKELGITRVEWIKVDVEGAECEALEGLSEILRGGPNIIVEVTSNNIERIKEFANGTDYHAIAISPLMGDKIYLLLTRRRLHVGPG
jgi:FkbM family methyltransferase